MFSDEILAFAKNLLKTNDADASLTALCEAASAELVARLRDGVDPAAIKTLFVSAAGILALSMYIAAGADGDVAAFRAGDLAVTRGGGRVSAASLRKQAENILAAYLTDRGFDFVGVRG